LHQFFGSGYRFDSCHGTSGASQAKPDEIADASARGTADQRANRGAARRGAASHRHHPKGDPDGNFSAWNQFQRFAGECRG